jgi:hypothetical protein
MKYILSFCLVCNIYTNAQIFGKANQRKTTQKDTLVVDSGRKDSLKIFKPTIEDYKYQIRFSEKKIFDTTLTADKTFIFSQYNNFDNFGKIQFANIGSGFNSLVFDINPEQNLSLLPSGKSASIIGINNIKYYDVKTPTTAFIYHNAVNNGAALQSTYTQNIGKEFNFAVEYMGLRSLGFYKNSLAANNNIIFSGHFLSKNEKYEAFAHFIHQNINNQENGGVADINLFFNGGNNFDNRTNLPVNLAGSDSRFSYRRYYFSQEFRPFNSDKFPFKIRHTIFHQGNKYRYFQSLAEKYYYSEDTELIDYPLSSKKYSEKLSNTLNIFFDNDNFKLNGGVLHQIIKFGIDFPIASPINFTDEISENRMGVTGNLQIKLWDKIMLNSDLEFSNGKEFGNFLNLKNLFKIEPVKGYFLNAKLNFQTSSPSFNLLLNPSIYRKFNYYFKNPKNQTITEIGGDINLKWSKYV